MSKGIRQQETEPAADRAGKRRNPGSMTAYSPEQIVSHAAAAGRAAYAESSAPVERPPSPNAPTTAHICAPSRPAGSRFWLIRHLRRGHPKKRRGSRATGLSIAGETGPALSCHCVHQIQMSPCLPFTNVTLAVVGVGRRAGAEPRRSAAPDRRPIDRGRQSHPLPSERPLARLVEQLSRL
jgi:hypothetical protein